MTKPTWISVSPTSGNKSATISVTANEPNNTGSSRSGNISISGKGITKTVSVSQKTKLPFVDLKKINVQEGYSQWVNYLFTTGLVPNGEILNFNVSSQFQGNFKITLRFIPSILSIDKTQNNNVEFNLYGNPSPILEIYIKDEAEGDGINSCIIRFSEDFSLQINVQIQ